MKLHYKIFYYILGVFSFSNYFHFTKIWKSKKRKFTRNTRFLANFSISRIVNSGTNFVVFCCNNIQPKKFQTYQYIFCPYFVTICNPVYGYVKIPKYYYNIIGFKFYR